MYFKHLPQGYENQPQKKKNKTFIFTPGQKGVEKQMEKTANEKMLTKLLRQVKVVPEEPKVPQAQSRDILIRKNSSKRLLPGGKSRKSASNHRGSAAVEVSNTDIQSFLAGTATSSLMDKTTAVCSDHRRSLAAARSKRTSMQLSLTRPFSNLSMMVEEEGLEDLHFSMVFVNRRQKCILEKFELFDKEENDSADPDNNLVDYFKEEIPLLN